MPPANRSKVPAGTILEGKFEILREIGRGGMAAVYEAEHVEIGKRVAVKLLAEELVSSRVVLGRFLREARATAAIRSPYICEVHDSGEWDGRPFLVMELLEGESLYELLTRERRLSIALTLRIAKQCSRGLGKAHDANVVHRDLKPENLFITQNEDGETVAKILDFGLAKFYEPALEGGDATRLTREGALFGTPAYMAPEQAKGQGEVDHRCDIWALGCIVYECLTGKTVWNADQGVAMILAQIAGAPIPRPSRVRTDLPTSFDEWFLKALARDPDKRFQTPKEFSDSLSLALDPPAGSVKKAPLHSAEEGEAIDALMSLPDIPIVTMEPGPDSSGRSEVARKADSGGTPPPVADPENAPESQKSGSSGARAVVALVGIAALALGGYAVWLYVLHPPPVNATAAPPATTASASAPVPAPPSAEPRETAPYALSIAKAQAQLGEGKRDESLATFKEAFNNGGTRVARGLLNQAGVVTQTKDGPCRVTGLSRPRPYDIKSRPFRPIITLSKTGPLFAWLDNHKDTRRREGFATLLDGSLGRLTPARALTPEAAHVSHAQIIPAGKKLALLYSNTRGPEPGVYARLLETDGRIAGPTRRLTTAVAKEYSPAIARTPGGQFWVVWEQRKAGSGDLWGRKLDTELKPAADPIRLTHVLSPSDKTPTIARNAALAIGAGRLYLTFELARKRESLIASLSIPLDDPGLSNGLPKDAKPEAEPSDGGTPGKYVGQFNLVSKNEGRNVQPQVACTKEACFVVWDDEAGGGVAALLDHKKGEPIWRREFKRRASRPTVASSGDVAAVAWYEIPAKKLQLARITRDGLGDASVIGRVGAFQNHPALTAGATPGEWYVTWRDFEAGHLETYLVRASCKTDPE